MVRLTLSIQNILIKWTFDRPAQVVGIQSHLGFADLIGFWEQRLFFPSSHGHLSFLNEAFC